MELARSPCDRTDHLLVVEDLTTSAPGPTAPVPLVNGVSFCLHDREILGVIGETGSGKTMTMLSIMGLLPGRVRITGGSIRYADDDLVRLDDTTYRGLRGREIGMIVQNARAALNPLMRVGAQIANVYRANTSLRGTVLQQHMTSVLQSVGFQDPQRIMRSYPHQLSGGMAQRVLIAIALGPDPRIVIADEPTSGLDTTVGARVLQTLKRTLRESESSGIIVTHDLGVVAHYCERLLVMRDGVIVEDAGTAGFFQDGPRTPYGRQLLEAHEWKGRQQRPEPDDAGVAEAGKGGTSA